MIVFGDAAKVAKVDEPCGESCYLTFHEAKHNQPIFRIYIKDHCFQTIGYMHGVTGEVRVFNQADEKEIDCAVKNFKESYVIPFNTELLITDEQSAERLKGVISLENRIKEIVDCKINFRGSEKQNIYANQIIGQVYENLIPVSVVNDLKQVKRDEIRLADLAEIDKECRAYNAIAEHIPYYIKRATEEFENELEAIMYEKSIVDGAVKQLSATEIIEKKDMFTVYYPLNNRFYYKTFKSRTEQGRKAPSIENGIKHFLETFRNSNN